MVIILLRFLYPTFLQQALIHPEHETSGSLYPCNGMHTNPDWTLFILSSKRRMYTARIQLLTQQQQLGWSPIPVSTKVSIAQRGLSVGCLMFQQHASVSQGRICSDNFTCCHTEIVVADPTLHLTQSKYTDTGSTSPSADPIMPGTWVANF